MTVLEITKDLIGSEDVNFGDSGTTFNRATCTGGTVAMSYVDAECIPSTTLGGYIGDNLHFANQDTGTTSTYFTINSAGDYAKLDTTGLTADRTFTFPNTSNQQLVGATDLAAITSGKGMSTIGVEDSSAYYTNTDGEAVLAEIGADIATLTAQINPRGYKAGFKFSYQSTTSINISGGTWEHNGTTKQLVYTEVQITFTFGSLGSNTSSTDLSPDKLHYVYIDDSAIITAGVAELTASEFINTETVPTFSEAKVGYYTSDDRCIGAILTNSSSEIIKFYVVSNDLYLYDVPTIEFDGTSGTTYTALNVSSSIPTFSTVGKFEELFATTQWFYTAITATGATTYTAWVNLFETTDIPLDTSQVFYWYVTTAVGTTISTVGYYINEL